MNKDRHIYFISATRLKLKSFFSLPAFMRANSASAKQLIKTDGFIAGKELIDKGLTFWTLTMWAQDADMRSFRNSEAHRNAMRHLPDWCNEATYTHWLQEDTTLPNWHTVHEKMITHGIVSKVRTPTEQHLNKAFPAPKWKVTEQRFKVKK